LGNIQSGDIWPGNIMPMYQSYDDRINNTGVVPGPNPTTSIYNATGSLARFENKNILFYFEKRFSLPVYFNACVVAVNSKVLGLAPGKLRCFL
jgi:hypothetical protein